mgnify:FL=1
MAEEKKGDKKGGAKPESKPTIGGFDMAESLIILFIITGLFSTLVPSIWRFFGSGEITFFGYSLSNITSFFSRNAFIFKFIGLFIAGLGAVATIIFNKKADSIWAIEKKRLSPIEISSSESCEIPTHNPTLGKWQAIVEKSESADEGAWRLAIIEADIMLDDLLQTE